MMLIGLIFLMLGTFIHVASTIHKEKKRQWYCGRCY